MRNLTRDYLGTQHWFQSGEGVWQGCILSPCLFNFYVEYIMGFLSGTNAKEPSYQCKGHKRCRFDSWLSKIPWRRAWQLPQVFLPGESTLTEEPGWLQSIESHRVGHDWSDLACTNTNHAKWQAGWITSWNQDFWEKYQQLHICRSVQFSRSVMSNSLQPNGLQHDRFPVYHQLLELVQSHVLRVIDAIQTSHPVFFTSPPSLNLFQHQGLFQWVRSSH